MTILVPKIITAPAAEPLLIANVKTRLSISDTLDDADLTAHIIAARQQAEEYMQRSIITQTLEVALNDFPDSIPLYKGPVQSITSVKYVDEDGVEQTLSSAIYQIDSYGILEYLINTYGNDWPTHRDDDNGIKIRYVTGWGASGASVPQDILEAMYKAIGHWMRFQAEAESGVGPTRMPRQFYDLLNRHRVALF